MSNAIRVEKPDTGEDSCAWSVLRGPADHQNVLRAFDGARRSISRKIVGHHGAFPGFDTLLLAPRPSVVDSDVVLLTATVVSRNETSHVVEYVAMRMSDGEQGDESVWPEGDIAEVIARGVGRTSHCEPASRTARLQPAQQRGGDGE